MRTPVRQEVVSAISMRATLFDTWSRFDSRAAGLDPERDFRPWLRPESEKWWRRINRFWEGDASALNNEAD
jgi:hypothetical protein